MSEMNGGQLRHAMKQVHMKENMQEEIIMNVRTQMADGTYRRNSFKRNMVSAAACLLVIGTVSIPAYAGYLGLRSAITSDKVMARMQEVPEAEVQDISHTSHTKIRHTTRNYATLGIWKRFFQFSGSLLIKRDTSSAIWHSDAL